MKPECIYIPEPLSKYLKWLTGCCIELQNSQNSVEQKFLKLGETWHDKIYFHAGENLLKVSAEVKILYTALADAVKGAIKISNKLNSIEGYENSEIRNVSIPEFSSKILGEDLKQMYGEKVENVINLDDMEAFSNELIKYTDETEEKFAALRRKHRDIGSDRIWVSPQYDQLTEIIDYLSKQMDMSIDNLRFSQAMVAAKHRELSAIIKSGIN